MADKIFKDATIKIDNASGTLTAITAYVTSSTFAGLQQAIEAIAMGSTNRATYPGTGGSTFSLAWFTNTTTDGIFGPLMGNRTSVAKTFEYYNGVKYYRAEGYPTGVQQTGSPNTMLTGSCDFQVDGAVTRTSVGL